MNPFINKPIVGFLTLAVAFAPLPTTGLRHTHTGGERAHSHDHVNASVEPAFHDRKHGEGQVITDNTVHVHFFWLGLDLGHQDESGNENRPVSPEAVFNVQLVGQAVAPVMTNCLSLQTKVDFLIWQAVVDDCCVALIYRAETQPPTPLCDAARLERSGVLLV